MNEERALTPEDETPEDDQAAREWPTDRAGKLFFDAAGIATAYEYWEDPAFFADEDDKTGDYEFDPEMQREIKENSLYTKALKHLDSTPSKSPYISRQQAAGYFFALHKDELDPLSNGDLTEDQATELQSIFLQYAKFYLDRDPDNRQSPQRVFADFISARDELQEDQKEELKALRYHTPKSFEYIKPKIFTEMLKGNLVNKGRQTIKTGNGMSITAIVELKPSSIFPYSLNISEFDWLVYDAICSIYDHGHGDHAFTVDSVCRVIFGKGDGESVTPDQRREVTSAIEKWRNTFLYIDCSDEFIKRGLIPPEDEFGNKSVYIVDGYMLSLIGETRLSGGRKVKTYYVDKRPAMKNYVEPIKQYRTFDLDRMNIKRVDKQGRLTARAISTSKLTGVASHFMLRRIDLMKIKPLRKISYKAFYEECEKSDIALKNRKAREKARNACKNVLADYKARGEIEKFEEYPDKHDRRILKGIKITMPGDTGEEDSLDIDEAFDDEDDIF